MSSYVSQSSYDPARAALYESLFMVGNGRFGLRGSDEERRHSAFRGTLVNGFFERKPIQYGEWAYGYAKDHETILNVLDAASIELELDGFPLDFYSGLERYERRLDLRAGRLDRELAWSAPSGARAIARSQRLASFARPSVAAMRYEVEAASPCLASLASFLDGSVRNRGAEEGDPRVGSHIEADPIAWERREAMGGMLLLAGRTRRSGLAVAACALHSAVATGAASPAFEGRAVGEELSAACAARLASGEALRLDKFVAIASGPAERLPALVEEAARAAQEAQVAGYDVIAAEQRDYLSRFWAGADIRIEGDVPMEEGLRFNLFHLLQSAGRDGATSIAAKGLSGEGYEGHYFWDTEIYALPFFAYEASGIARSLVRYRLSLLGKARARAQELSLPGALFPWRTIDGDETSAYYPAGTAQFHIDADIAFALLRYVDASGDESIMEEGGAELLVETARLWMGLGFFNPRKDGRFCIPCVTGPDEYTALVDNNAYTNLMAELNLRAASAWARRLADRGSPSWASLRERLGVEEAEVSSWLEAADRMYIPYDEASGIVPQDDQFMDRPAWDLGATPREGFPLLLHYHPLMIYRRRVLKQPDVVLAMFLRHERFSLAEKLRNFRFYEPITTGDSSLSHCIQSLAAAEAGETEKAYDYFARTARMDLDDLHGNSRDGVHIAAMAGSWISLVYGFAGMRERGGALSFSPRLPARWTRLSFSISYRGSRFAAEYSRSRAEYRLVEGPALELEHEGKRYRLTRESPIEIDETRRPLAWLFDLDGVIADTATLHFQAWERLADDLGLPFDRERGELIKGVSREASLLVVLGDRAGDYGEAERAALAERKNGYYRELLERLSPADVLAGMAELLASLKGDGRTIVLASASRNAPAILERLDLASAFDAVVDPATLAMPKPDPEIFLRAAELSGARLADCVAIEDAQAGIDAIAAAGIFSVGIGESLERADIAFRSTGELTRSAVEAAFYRRAADKEG